MSERFSKASPVAILTVLIALSAWDPVLGGTMDRSALLGQLVIDPATGEISQIPANYAATGAPDRAAQMAALTVNTSTWEIDPSTLTNYVNTYAPDRAAQMAALTVNTSTWEIDPSTLTNYVATGAPDRAVQMAALAVNTSTWEITPGTLLNYVPTGARDLLQFMSGFEFDPATGELLAWPDVRFTSSPIGITGGSVAPALSVFGVLALAAGVLATGIWFLKKTSGL